MYYDALLFIICMMVCVYSIVVEMMYVVKGRQYSAMSYIRALKDRSEVVS